MAALVYTGFIFSGEATNKMAIFSAISIVLYIIGYFLWKKGVALKSTPSIKQVDIKIYNVEEGLSQSKVSAIIQDQRGLLWIGTAGGGVVTITMNGHQIVTEVDISGDVVDEDDIETLQDVVMAAINDASNKSQEMASKHLSSITGGLGIPGL